MEAHLSPEILAGLEKARAQSLRSSKRLRIHTEDADYPILRLWNGGFSVLDEDVPNLRGTVEIRDGSRVLHECLIVCSAQEGPERAYEVKRLQQADGIAPVDFERAPDAPVALLAAD